MSTNKKGDLALSTNAIVILIVAVLILGILITFIVHIMQAATDRGYEHIPLPPPLPPSGANPITVTDVIASGRGSEFGMKISVFNPTPGPISDVKPSISCIPVAGVVATNALIASPRTIAASSYETFTVIVSIAPNASIGQNFCSITADGIVEAGQTDVVIQVAR